MVGVPQLSFTGGEWAPALYARADLDKYRTAVKKLRNFFSHAHGGASNRPGTYFVGETKDSSKTSRLIPFQFSTVQSYMLEFGDQYMRVYKDGGRVTESDQNITAVTQADPAVVTITSHGLSDGDWVYISGVVGMTELNGKIFKVASSTTHTFALQDVDGNDVDSTAYTAYGSGGTAARVYTLTTPYLEADLSLLKVTQSADVLYVTHPTYAPRKITRTGHAAWTITAMTFAPSVDAPTSFARSAGAATGHTYAVTAVTDEGEESVVSNTATGGPGDTFGWTPPSGSIDHYEFYELQNGVYGWLGYAGLGGGSPTFIVPASTDPDMEEAPPTAKNPFNATDDYPGVSTFFQQRWVPARTNNKPQTLWGSVTGSFENMNVRSPIRDDDSYQFTIDSRQVNEIRWMVPLDALIIGTSGSEWKMAAGQTADSVTPTSVSLKQQSEWGVSHIQPLVIGNTILFIDASETKIRDLLYSLEVDGYDGNDLSVLAPHLFEGETATRWCYQKSPDPIVWVVRSDGILLGMTYQREHKVWGWHRHDTDGFFEDVSSIQIDDGTIHVYFIVRRTINGVTRRYVERFASRVFSDVRDAYFVDCGLSLDTPIAITGATKASPVVVTAVGHGFSDGDIVDISDVVGMVELNGNQYKVANKTTDTFELTNINDDTDIDGSTFTTYVSGGYVRKAVTSVSGLDHLEGETLAIFANGNYVSKTVSNGAITLDNAASRIHAGLAYTQDIHTLDFNYYQTDTGTAQDKTRYVSSVVLKLKDTRALFVGPPLIVDPDTGVEDDSRLLEIPFREDEDYGDPIRMFTGDKEYQIEQGKDFRQAEVFMRNPYPVPVTVLAVIPRVVHGEH